jgi:hypothetical protein
LKIRAGWGQLGSLRQVSADNQFTTFFSGVGFSNYDINRNQTGTTVGYSPFRSGSITTQWETAETTNVGFDASMNEGKIDLGFNYFINNTENLLVAKQKGAVEGQVSQPFINLGKMQNTGFEFNVTNRGMIGGIEYDATLLFTRYVNEVIDIDGNEATFFTRNASRLNNVVRTSVGQPVSYFWGYERDGFFESQADIDALSQTGAVIGSWRYKDQDGDGAITDADQVILGSPHPDFVTSMNLDLRYKAFDFNAFLVWNYGNELYNYNKYFTDMRVFVGGVSSRVLEDGWTESNRDADLPLLAPGAESGYTSFTRSTSNDYYIESGSYLRMRTMQIGYTFDSGILDNLGLSSGRVYLQGQNLFTITNYQGPDPDVNISGQNPNDDLKMGVDESGFPAARQIIVGISVSL